MKRCLGRRRCRNGRRSSRCRSWKASRKWWCPRGRGSALRVSAGTILGLQRGQILHKASSKLDAPGAPIWIEAGKRRLLVGIVSSVFSKDSGLNLGCYLSQETENQLMEWINVDHQQSELEVQGLSPDELEFVL